MPTKLLRCSCDGYLGKKQGSQFQEETYKGGLRVHNSISKDNTWRCTVCQNEKTSGGGDEDGKKKKK